MRTTARALLLAACLSGSGAHAGALAPEQFARVQLSAGAGDVQGAFDLGRMYRNGIGVAADSARGLAWIGVAAKGGHAAAMFVLANMLIDGEGTARDAATGRRWLEQAAALNYPEALQQLALQEPDARTAAQLMRQVRHALQHRALEH
jgi:TPR repeat protein